MKLHTVTDIAAMVKSQRKLKGWTQAQLAERAGVSRDWLISVEKGKASAEFGMVLRTLRALDLTLSAEPKPESKTLNYLDQLRSSNLHTSKS